MNIIAIIAFSIEDFREWVYLQSRVRGVDLLCVTQEHYIVGNIQYICVLTIQDVPDYPIDNLMGTENGSVNNPSYFEIRNLLTLRRRVVVGKRKKKFKFGH